MISTKTLRVGRPLLRPFLITDADSNADNVSIWWRNHVNWKCLRSLTLYIVTRQQCVKGCQDNTMAVDINIYHWTDCIESFFLLVVMVTTGPVTSVTPTALLCLAQWFLWTKCMTAGSRFAPSQWETVFLCNDVSHWLGANLESALCIIYWCRWGNGSPVLLKALVRLII